MKRRKILGMIGIIVLIPLLCLAPNGGDEDDEIEIQILQEDYNFMEEL